MEPNHFFSEKFKMPNIMSSCLAERSYKQSSYHKN